MSAMYGEDADSYWGRMERQAQRYPKCACCEEPIYPGDKYYEFSEMPFGGTVNVCPDCVMDYLDDHGYAATMDDI